MSEELHIMAVMNMGTQSERTNLKCWVPLFLSQRLSDPMVEINPIITEDVFVVKLTFHTTANTTQHYMQCQTSFTENTYEYL